MCHICKIQLEMLEIYNYKYKIKDCNIKLNLLLIFSCGVKAVAFPNIAYSEVII